MSGLLDMLQTASQDPATSQGILRFGLSLLQSKGNLGGAIGQAGMQGLQGAQDYRQQQFQRQIQQSQLDQIKRQKEMQNLPGQFVTPAQKLPTQDNADVGQPGEPPVTPAGFDFSGYVNALMGKDPLQAIDLQQKLAKPTSKYSTTPQYDQNGQAFVLNENGDRKNLAGVAARDKLENVNGQWVNPYSTQTKGIAPQDPNKPFAVGPDGKPLANAAYQQYELGKAKLGATNVSVNTGQHGFDNTLKLRTDLRSEPIYKAHQEVQSAYSQIKEGLKSVSPAGDLAAATKIMKLLDPSSVVRESELGMAMAATGLGDRVKYYAENIVNGTKLNPAQREDFRKLAESLYSESSKLYNKKRGEYEAIAQRNGLNAQDVVGAPAEVPTARPGSGGFTYLGKE